MHTNQPITFWTALARGFSCRCSNCGKGKMFSSFLKVNDTCPNCGEELHHHRADDMPAYIIILVAGHIIVPLVAIVEIAYSPPYWVHAVIWLPFSLILCIGLLQPVKGAVVATQWVKGMEGFQPSRQRRQAKFALPTEGE